MADKGFIDKSTDLVPTESPTTRTKSRVLKGNLTNSTVSEALKAYIAQRKGRASEATIKKLNTMEKSVKNIRLNIHEIEGKPSLPMTLSEVKMGDLHKRHIVEAIGSALQDQEGHLNTVNGRRNTREVLQPFIKAVADNVDNSYFNDMVSTAIGKDLYDDVLNTKADRSLITIHRLDHGTLSRGYGNVLSKLVDKPADARAFALMVTGGFRPSDLESLSLEELRVAVEDDILQYKTKTSGKREFRYRPVLPEHKAIYQKILQDADLAGINDPNAKAFPQGKDWSKLIKGLNAELLEQFGDKFLNVEHPHTGKTTKDPVTVGTLRHHMESRLFRVGLTSEQSRQDIMGRSKNTADMGGKYAAVYDRIGPGSQAYNLALQGNDILSLESSSKGSAGLALDWMQDEDVKTILFADPTASSVERPIQVNMNQIASGERISYTKEAYEGRSDALAAQTKVIKDERAAIINKLVTDYQIDREYATNTFHRHFDNVEDINTKLYSLHDVPIDQRNIESASKALTLHQAETQKPFTSAASRKEAEKLAGSFTESETYVPEGGNALPDNVNSLDDALEHSKTFLSRAAKAGKYVFPPLAVASGVLSTQEAYAEEEQAEKYYSDKGQEMPFAERAYLETSKFTAPVLGAAAIPLKDVKDMGVGLKGIGERSPVAEKMIRRSGARGRNKYQKRLMDRQNVLRENPRSFVQRPEPEPNIEVDESGFEAEYKGFALQSNN